MTGLCINVLNSAASPDLLARWRIAVRLARRLSHDVDAAAKAGGVRLAVLEELPFLRAALRRLGQAHERSPFNGTAYSDAAEGFLCLARAWCQRGADMPMRVQSARAVMTLAETIGLWLGEV